MDIFQENPKKYFCKDGILEIIVYDTKLLISFKSQIGNQHKEEIKQ